MFSFAVSLPLNTVEVMESTAVEVEVELDMVDEKDMDAGRIEGPGCGVLMVEALASNMSDVA
jgi:hypothetical protein